MSVSTSTAARPSARASAPVALLGSWSPWSRRTWLATIHLVLDLPVGMLWGTLVVALVAASIGLLPLALFGAALLIVTLAGSLLAARGERARARILLGAESPVTTPLPRTWTGWLRLLVDGRAWLACLYGVVLLPLGILNVTVAVTGWTLVLAGLTSQGWAWLQPARTVTIGSWTVAGEPAVILTTTVAIVLGFLMPSVVRGLAAIDGWLQRALLR
jgi:hypothetical protein